MRWRPGHVLIPCLAALPLAACGNAGVPHDLTVRDSAGITIVENERGALESAPRWSVADSPSLRIGVVEGDSVYQFTRVGEATRLSDGGVAVLDGGPNALRIFGPDGRFVASQGGRGDGPGEYQSPRGLFALPGDSLVVFDTRQSRITVLAPPAAESARLWVARIVTPEPTLARPAPLGMLDDGRLVVRANQRETEGRSRMPEQDMDLWVVSTADAAAADSIARFPRGAEGFVQVPFGMLLTGPTFAPSTLSAAAGDSVAVATARSHEVRFVGSDGALRRIVRWSGPSLEVTASDRETYARRTKERYADEPDRLRQQMDMIEAMGFSDTYAAHDRMLLARSGHIWLRDGQRAHEDWSSNRAWTVLSPRGRIDARITLPEQLTPLEVGEDWVLGRWTDELGVQYVALFEVEEREGQATRTGGGS